MQKISTYRIQLTGIVQGVGFRPFVYHLAQSYSLKGFVINGLEGVVIVFHANKTTAEHFYDAVVNQAPSKAKIISRSLEVVDYQFFEKFEIRESNASGKPNLVLTPDYAMCADCANELKDESNRRLNYPFITCTNCGPRYSITENLPYDREQTTMSAFEMCPDCRAEYENPTDRRFYSQTNSCPNCAIKISVYDNQQKLISDNQNEVIGLIISYLRNNKIIAIKGVGGYLLICDATKQSVVETLRIRKHRPSKPFAVMFSDISEVEKNAVVTEIEKETLQSDVAPIVILQQKNTTEICESVNPKLSKLGVMLPYSPLLKLICEGFGEPIVATSGNISGNPIIYDDEKALTDFAEIADFVITNNRKITIPQDDSVVQFSKRHQKKIILRRSRGFSLAFSSKSEGSALAVGASMKSTFALQTENQLYVSQYLGDLESYETQQNYEKVMNHFLQLFQNSYSIQEIFADAHSGYFSTELAQKLAELWHIKLKKIQHHEAHFSAVLAENSLKKESVLGIIWDGTGYGTDGNIWGGEFFYEIENQTKRIHFQYFDAILGDKMPREPRISALSLGQRIEPAERLLKEKFSNTEWGLFTKILSKNELKTSSVGRIFDAVASLIGLSEKQSYEGEAAVYLEQSAQRYFDENDYQSTEHYSFEIEGNEILINPMFREIVADLLQNKSQTEIAAKFHFTLVKIIDSVANLLKIKELAFSGGVFQNSLLVDLIIHFLESKYKLYFHKNLSPNDECIAYGQINS